MINKLLIICGPTATGKTSLGLRLAKKFSGEIVSADSRQIYRYMDIGTGKDLPKGAKFQIPIVRLQTNSKSQPSNPKYLLGYYQIDRLKIWLYDVVEPDYQFSVADYIRCASLIIENIWKRGNLPIVVGGTGFYLRGLAKGIGTMGIEPDWRLRRELQSSKVLELQRKLKEINPEKWKGMNESDRENPRRLIRAIEIAKNKQPALAKASAGRQTTRPRQGFGGQALWIGLRAPNKELYRRIDNRVDKRVEQGVEKEIKYLLEKGYHWENSILGTTLGYKEWRPFFEGIKSRKKVIQEWKFNEHGYARRQMTWFKKVFRSFTSAQGKQDRGKWFDITCQGWQNEVEKVVKRWYID